MRFSAIATALLAPLCAQANVMFTNNEYSGIADGVPFTLAWSGDGTPVNITLLSGPTQMLTKVDVVAVNVSGSSYSWTPSKTIQEDFYALSITQSEITNYSPRFLISGTSVPTRINKHMMTPFPHEPFPPGPSPSGTAVQAGAVGYNPPFPTYTAISGFNTSSTTSSAHIRYVNTISPDTRATTGSSLGLYPTGPAGQPTAIATLAHSSFTGGALRLRGLGLGCSVAAVFAVAVLAGWAF